MYMVLQNKIYVLLRERLCFIVYAPADENLAGMTYNCKPSKIKQLWKNTEFLLLLVTPRQ